MTTRRAKPTLARLPMPAKFTARQIAKYLANTAHMMRNRPTLHTVYAAMLAWAGTRFALVLVTYYNLLLVPGNLSLTAVGQPVYTFRDFLMQFWFWDAGWYIGTADHSYQHASEAGWFPGYSLLIHAGTTLLPGIDDIAVAVLVNNICSLVALIAFALLARRRGINPIIASRTWLAYPFALYLFVAYSEGAFLAFAATALLAAETRRWWLAIPAAVLASATRPFGVCLVLPLLWQAGASLGWWHSLATQVRLLRRGAHSGAFLNFASRVNFPRLVVHIGAGFAAGLSPLLGLAAYGVYCAARWHDFFLFVHAQQSGNNHATLLPWTALGISFQQWGATAATSYPHARIALDLVPLVGSLLIMVLAARKLPVADTLYLASVNLLILLTPAPTALFPDIFVAAGRYILVALPVFWYLARLFTRHPSLEALWLATGFTLQATLLWFLFHHGWLV